MKITEKILKLLRHSESYISGETLAQELKISRTSIWKHINELRELGYKVDAVSNQGYCLKSSPDRLYDWELSEVLNTKDFAREYHYYDNLDSTMDTASRLAMDGCSHGTVVLAETQGKGRGRLQREWVSTKYKGLYFSLVLRPELSLNEISKLTLLAGLAVLKTVRKLTSVDCLLKWPNDILVNGKKLCGILTELNAEPDRVNFVVVGIGININNSDKQLLDIATSIYKDSGKKTNRSMFAAELLFTFEQLYLQFLDNGFGLIKEEWSRYCCLWGERVKINRLKDSFEGTAHSLDDDGTLLVRTDHGTIERVLTGDVQRLRAIS